MDAFVGVTIELVAAIDVDANAPGATSTSLHRVYAPVELVRAWMTPSIDSCAHRTEPNVAIRKDISLWQNPTDILDGEEIPAGRGANITPSHGGRAKPCGSGGYLLLRLYAAGDRDFVDPFLGRAPTSGG
jgi:hypothetical protein